MLVGWTFCPSICSFSSDQDFSKTTGQIAVKFTHNWSPEYDSWYFWWTLHHNCTDIIKPKVPLVNYKYHMLTKPFPPSFSTICLWLSKLHLLMPIYFMYSNVHCDDQFLRANLEWQLKPSIPIDDIVALGLHVLRHTLIHCLFYSILCTVLSPKNHPFHRHTPHTHSPSSGWRCPLLCQYVMGGRCVLSPAVMPLNLPTVSIFAYQNNKNNLGRSEISIIGGKAV